MERRYAGRWVVVAALTGAVVLSNAAGEPMALTHNAIVAVDGGTPRSTSNPFDPFNAVVLGIAALVLYVPA